MTVEMGDIIRQPISVMPIHVALAKSACIGVQAILREILIYSRYITLFHLCKVFTVESSRPLAASVEAAPMQKLCPEYLPGSTLAASRTSLTAVTSHCAGSVVSHSETKQGTRIVDSDYQVCQHS